MTDTNTTDDRKFEIAIRAFGKEVIAVSLFSSSASQKWIWISLGAIAAVAVGFVLYGADVSTFYRSLVQ